MKKVTINGREITTNYYAREYSIDSGNGRATMTMCLRRWVLHEGEKYKSMETLKEMFERLVSDGYTKITFFRTTTAVRGLYDYIAYCK